MYKTMIIDPPWDYNRKAGTGVSNDHYDSLAHDELKQLPVSELAHPEGAVLFLWCTNPMNGKGHELLQAWGFEFRTKLPWVKVTMRKGRPTTTISWGNGSWVRGCSEDILIATQGDIRPPDPSDRVLGLLEGVACLEAPDNRWKQERYKHSRKPDTIHHLAELFPGPRIELFATQKRAGWKTLGNEIDGQDIRRSLQEVIQ